MYIRDRYAGEDIEQQLQQYIQFIGYAGEDKEQQYIRFIGHAGEDIEQQQYIQFIGHAGEETEQQQYISFIGHAGKDIEQQYIRFIGEAIVTNRTILHKQNTKRQLLTAINSRTPNSHFPMEHEVFSEEH